MKIYKCDKCGKEKEWRLSSPFPEYPKKWYLVKLYSKAQAKGGRTIIKGYHICKQCKEKIFGK